jgi:GNAT superfamily N-acetyltransferase
MPWLPQVHTPEQDQNYFALVLDSQECWVAVIENQIVGFSVLNEGWLDHLYVLPESRGIGIGRELLDNAKEFVASELQLWTFQGNHYARAFYAKNGFAEVEFTDGFKNEELTPDVRLIWRRVQL